MLFYHKTRAKLRGCRYVLRNLFHVMRGDEDFSPKNLRTIYYRLGTSKYWDEVATQWECGCYGYGDHITLHLMDCPHHGLDSLFPEVDEEEL